MISSHCVPYVFFIYSPCWSFWFTRELKHAYNSRHWGQSWPIDTPNMKIVFIRNRALHAGPLPVLTCHSQGWLSLHMLTLKSNRRGHLKTFSSCQLFLLEHTKILQWYGPVVIQSTASIFTLTWGASHATSQHWIIHSSFTCYNSVTDANNLPHIVDWCVVAVSQEEALKLYRIWDFRWPMGVRAHITAIKIIIYSILLRNYFHGGINYYMVILSEWRTG